MEDSQALFKVLEKFVDLLNKQIEGDAQLNSTMKIIRDHIDNVVKSDEFIREIDRLNSDVKEKMNQVSGDMVKLTDMFQKLAGDFNSFKTVVNTNGGDKSEILADVEKTKITTTATFKNTVITAIVTILVSIIGTLGIILKGNADEKSESAKKQKTEQVDKDNKEEVR